MCPGFQTAQQKLIQVTPLPQVVPSRVCLSCDVCCRFPEEDSFLRPYFTAEEIQRAVARGLDPAWFPDAAGCQITVVPDPSRPPGEGYLCPAFDPATNGCRIYDVRPLDCQIYPLALMWNQDRSEVLLGWDSKCPFLGKPGKGFGARGVGPENLTSNLAPRASFPDIEAYAAHIMTVLDQDDVIELLDRNPRLIGPFQDDVVVLRTVPRLTARLTASREAGGESPRVSASPCPSPSEGVTRRRGDAASLDLRPLTLDDRPLVERALASTEWIGETPLAACAFAPHFIWREQFSYWRADLAGHLCLFAEYQDGIFMPLPPLPSGETGLAPREAYLADNQPHASHFTLHAEHPSSFANALACAFAFMRSRNKGSAVTRVENVPEELKPSLETLGYRLVPKDSDYLYRAADLARLAGDRYKSQRAACNRFTRTQRYRYEPYEPARAAACLALHRQWIAQQEARDPLVIGPAARQMLRDSVSAHREALLHHRELGLTGSVVWVDEAVRAYSVGFELTPSVFCVLLEVADRSIPGLAQFIFRECCREAVDRGYAFINTMDDSGLPSLGRSKRAYHPLRLVPNYILSEA